MSTDSHVIKAQNNIDRIVDAISEGKVLNPPNNFKSPCSICNKNCLKNQACVQCDHCDKWCHIKEAAGENMVFHLIAKIRHQGKV